MRLQWYPILSEVDVDCGAQGFRVLVVILTGTLKQLDASGFRSSMSVRGAMRKERASSTLWRRANTAYDNSVNDRSTTRR